jgi:hypothetical protein
MVVIIGELEVVRMRMSRVLDRDRDCGDRGSLVIRSRLSPAAH